MTPEFMNFTSLLGRPHTDPKIAELLHSLDLADHSIRLKKGDYSTGLASSIHGVDLIFSSPFEYGMENIFQEGSLIFNSVFFFAEGIQGHKQYPHPLPLGLNFNLSREAVRKLLSHPEWSSPILPTDRWDWENKKVAVRFAEEEGSIEYISCTLKK